MDDDPLSVGHNWVKIKSEELDIKEEIPDAKSIVLKFKKETDGNYSVIPQLTPDPFYEVHLADDKTSIELLEEKSSEDNNNNNTKKSNYCARCFLYAKNKQKLKIHEQRVHPRRTRSCTFCKEKNFKEPLTLQMHLLFRHKDNEKAMQLITRQIFSCQVCAYSSLRKNNYKRHLLTHQPKKNSNKDINKGNTYNCYHCPYGVTDRGSIIKHLRLHKSAEYKPFTCTDCNTKYNEKSCLDSHIVKRHLNNKKLIASLTNKIYECEFCDYKDVNKAKVLRHKRRHFK